MAGLNRDQRRDRRGDVPVYGADTSLGWRVVKMATVRQAVEKLGRGEWCEVHDHFGNFAGCQVLTRIKTDSDLASRNETASYITATESRVNAGLHGQSRTYGMNEEQRLTRHARYDPDRLVAPEDHIERARAKVAQWPFPASRIDDGTGPPVYGDRAMRCYPRAPVKG